MAINFKKVWEDLRLDWLIQKEFITKSHNYINESITGYLLDQPAEVMWTDSMLRLNECELQNSDEWPLWHWSPNYWEK